MGTANEIHLQRVHPAYLHLTEETAALAARGSAVYPTTATTPPT